MYVFGAFRVMDSVPLPVPFILVLDSRILVYKRDLSLICWLSATTKQNHSRLLLTWLVSVIVAIPGLHRINVNLSVVEGFW